MSLRESIIITFISIIMSKNYRAQWHNYRSRCRYHITLMKNPKMPPFGHLAGDYRLPIGTTGSSYIKATPLGQAVKAALREISTIHPALKVYQYALMPDHLHIFLSVESELDEILGRKIGWFKLSVNNKANMNEVFEHGFHDAIINPSREFTTLINYLRSNPYRLAVRRAYPEFFSRRNNIMIDGTPCQAYGNLHLLDNPITEQVVVHRADDKDTRQRNHDRWMHCAANGGVLVSPFISPDEKAVREEAESLDSRIILLRNIPLSEREKPSPRDFDLCTQGRMLIIAPLQPTALSREACLNMNSRAAYICNTTEYALIG